MEQFVIPQLPDTSFSSSTENGMQCRLFLTTAEDRQAASLSDTGNSDRTFFISPQYLLNMSVLLRSIRTVWKSASNIKWNHFVDSKIKSGKIKIHRGGYRFCNVYEVVAEASEERDSGSVVQVKSFRLLRGTSHRLSEQHYHRRNEVN